MKETKYRNSDIQNVAVVTARTVIDYLTDDERGANCCRFPYATAKMLAEGRGVRVLPCTALTADINVARRIAQTYNELTNISDMMEVRMNETAEFYDA